MSSRASLQRLERAGAPLPFGSVRFHSDRALQAALRAQGLLCPIRFVGEDFEVELCRDLEIRRLLPLLAGCGIRRIRGRFACVRIPLRADQAVKLQAVLHRRARVQGRRQLQRMERSAGQLSFPFVC